MGYAATTVTVDPESGMRSCFESSFLQNAKRNTTLKLYQCTTAKQVVFDANKKEAGITVETDNETY